MIDWGNTPPGSVATIYWPGLHASKVLALANSIYASHLLSAADGHTIQCVTTRGRHLHPHPTRAERQLRRPAHYRSAGHDHPRPSVQHRGATGLEPTRPSAAARRRLLRRELPPSPCLAPAKGMRPRGEGDKNQGRASTGVRCAARSTSASPSPTPHMLPLEEDTLAILKWRLNEATRPIAGARLGALHRVGGRAREGAGRRSRSDPAVAWVAFPARAATAVRTTIRARGSLATIG